MSNGALAEYFPRTHEFLIGRYGDRPDIEDRRFISIVQRDDQSRWPIFGLVVNTSPTGDLDGTEAGTDLTLRIRESDDRGAADKFFVHATGTITISGAVSDGETVTVDDGTIAPVFEFDNTGAIGGLSNVAVPISATTLANAQNLADAINNYGTGGQQQLLIEAIVDNTGANPVINVKHKLPGVVGNNALAETGVNIAVVGMANGAEANEVTVRRNGANVATVTVKPGGRAVFIVEAATKEYVRFDTDEENAQGQLVLSAWGVNLERWQRDASV